MQKRLSEEVRKGKIGVPDALAELKKHGFKASSLFKSNLRLQQGGFLGKKVFF